MKSKTTKGLIFAVAMLALTLVASAAPKAKKVSLTLFSDTTVSGTTLKPGEYQVVIEDNSATFLREGREVVKVAVETQEAPQKFAQTEVLTDGNTLKELDLGGTTTKLIVK